MLHKTYFKLILTVIRHNIIRYSFIKGAHTLRGKLDNTQTHKPTHPQICKTGGHHTNKCHHRQRTHRNT